jgi:transcription antitermination factor NusG
MQSVGKEGFQPGNENSNKWYALHTRSQHEKVVANILNNKGFEVFLPLYLASHQWKDRTKQLSLPLFSCYVFLRDSLERRLDILKTPGVHQIVGSGGRPAEIPIAEIESIRSMVGTSLKVEPHPLLRCGDRVRVKTGPLTGIEGILIRKKSLLRLVITVEMLGKAVAVEVDGYQVERLATKGAITFSGASALPTTAYSHSTASMS